MKPLQKKTNLTTHTSYYKKQGSVKSSFKPDSIKVIINPKTLFVITSFLETHQNFGDNALCLSAMFNISGKNWTYRSLYDVCN